MAKRKPATSRPTVLGRWRIVQMDEWDTAYVDAEEKAYIEFREDGRGEFHFGYCHGSFNWQDEPRGKQVGAAWTFEGNDEMEPMTGRGWAALKADGTMRGHLYFHRGMDSGFRATREG